MPTREEAREISGVEDVRYTDSLEDAISRAYAVKTDKHKYILLENDLPDNY